MSNATKQWTRYESSSSIVHFVLDDPNTDRTECGKPIENMFETANDVSCSACRTVMRRGKSYRMSRDFDLVCRELLEDMDARPGAYLHANTAIMNRIRALVIRMKSETGT